MGTALDDVMLIVLVCPVTDLLSLPHSFPSFLHQITVFLSPPTNHLPVLPSLPSYPILTAARPSPCAESSNRWSGTSLRTSAICTARRMPPED